MKMKMFFWGKVCFLVWFVFSAAQAMNLDVSSIAEITTGENHQVFGYEQTFAVSGDVAVWLDYRDPEWIPRIYGVNLSDPNYFEFEVDLNATAANWLTMSGPQVTYPIQEPAEQQYMRIADISSQSEPFLFDMIPQIPYINLFDISGSMIAYVGGDPENNYRDKIFAADVTDPNNVQQFPICLVPENASVRGLVLDADYLNWSVEVCDSNSVVQVAEITNPAEPNIQTAQLPAGISFDFIDASGSWLVAQGREDWRYRVYAVHHYQDVYNWDIQVLWKEGDDGESLVSGPCVDGPVAVWVVTTRMPSLTGQYGLLSEAEYCLKAAYLMGNGNFTVSTLLKDSRELGAAELSGFRVVWSMRSMDVLDLFNASIELECGDWGYKAGDLDKDCKVDLKDFARMAQDWLACTLPDQEECEFGS